MNRHRQAPQWLRYTGGAALAWLAGCGGGGGGPSVSTLVASPVMYSRTMVVTVNGLDLDQGITMSVEGGCSGAAAMAGGNATTQQFSCVVDAIGPLRVQLHRTGAGRLAQLALDVPLPQARLTTTKGTIEIELDPTRVKATVDNFLKYLNEGFYRGVIFHRVDTRVNVIQSGGFFTGPTGPVFKTATHASIPLESDRGLKNLRGTLGMARQADPDSANSQFYFNVQDNPAFDYLSESQPGYAVFGRVTVGQDVVDAIAAVPVASRGALVNGFVQILSNVPVDEITITATGQIR